MKKVINQVKEYIEKYQMIKYGDKVIAGISGGADSVCLFFVLLELKKELGFSFVAVHVNHGLRGAAADADEVFVKALCERYDVPLEIFRVNLESIAKKRKQSLEEAGRIVRREAFTQVMRQYAGARIALAHHQNDNAETLLWNLVRGTGLYGLCGIRPVNGFWIRPLLCLNRQEIENWLREKEQEYCTDLTNLETTYTRNKLRHQVIPMLETEINPAAVRHMNETMEQMCELRAFVEEETRKAAKRCVCGAHETGYRISEQEWRALSKMLQKEVIYDCLEKLNDSRRDLGRVHIEAVAELFDKQSGRSRQLAGNIHAVREYEGVLLERVLDAKQEPFSGMKIQIPGVTEAPEMGLRICTRVFQKTNNIKVEEIPQKSYTKWFDYDIINCLYIRTRQSGDSIVIDDAGHRQKLKSWFVNEKIPANERGRLPLLADGSRVVWIIGHRMSSAYHVSERTEHILQIEVQPMQANDSGSDL